MAFSRLQIIARADDAGCCQSANLAIATACHFGAIRNVSFMAPGPNIAQAAALLQKRRRIDCGLHVVLNAEWDDVKWGPVLPPESVPSLVDENGHFLASPNLLHEKGFVLDEAVAEIEAQLALLRELGVPVSYVDEHMGVSWIGLREEIANLCAREGLIDAHGFSGLPRAPTPTGDIYEDFLAALRAAPDGTFVYVTHPGLDAPDMRVMGHAGLELGQIARERAAETALLVNPALKDELRRLDVEVIRYSDAPR